MIQYAKMMQSSSHSITRSFKMVEAAVMQVLEYDSTLSSNNC